MLEEIKETLGLLLKDPKSAIVAGAGNATTAMVGYLDWLPQSDLVKVSMILAFGVTTPLIFIHWVRLCKDVYELKNERRKWLDGEAAIKPQNGTPHGSSSGVA